MLFHSVEFAGFFVSVFVLYLILSHRWQNRMLLFASYLFYASWDWRFLSLILISTILDYICGIRIDESEDPKTKKFFLHLSVVGNLTILGIFKYFNFFAFNLQSLLNLFGFDFEPYIFSIVLPIAISFYTFKTLSYTISIYWGQLKPTRIFLDYALFLSFFPALLSGPIDRAKALLPQISSPRKITSDKFYEGCYLIFWGLFQKLFIADNLANITGPLFASSAPYDGAMVLPTLYAYVIQIYCDFAGYTNMALGLGKVLGFDMMNNFNLPFFATNISDFWRRWHISLSTWVRDFIFTPLFVALHSVKGDKRIYISLVVTMTLLGLWHGSAWNFLLFGLYYGILLVIHQIIQPKLKRAVNPKSGILKSAWFLVRIVFMFHITSIAVLMFGSKSLLQVYDLLHSIFLNLNIFEFRLDIIARIIFYSWILIVLEIIQYRKNDLMVVLKWNPLARAVFYFICFYFVIIFGVEGGQEYIYAQF